MSITHRILDSRTIWLSEQSALLPVIRRATTASEPCDDPQNDGPMPWDAPLYTMEGGVAVISIRGVIVRECSAIEAFVFGLCSSSRICDAVATAESDPAVSHIFLDIDSPGGEVCGTPECADVIAACKKPVGAWSGGLMASAAYWIASHARHVSASKSANVGSIGVISTLYDFSALYAAMGIKPEIFTDSPLKGTGNPAKPMTDEQREYVQAHVDEIGVSFRAAVGARMKYAKPDAMQGQCFIGESAKAAGLLQDVITRASAVASLILLPTAASQALNTMTLPEQLAANELKLTAATAELAAANVKIAELEASLASSKDAIAATASASAAELSAKSAALDAATTEIAALKASAKSAEQLAAEMLAQVGQSKPVPAVEKKTSAVAPKPLTGLDRAIAAARALVAKN